MLLQKKFLESYANAEFFTKLPDVDSRKLKLLPTSRVKVTSLLTYLSPGHQAHSRADRELHGQCMITPEAQQEIVAVQA